MRAWLLIAALLVPTTAAAEGPSGLVSASLHVREGDLGGGAQIDLWHSLGRFQIGGTFGVSILKSDQAENSRAVMPIGPSLAILIYGENAGLTLRVAGGLLGGATDAGLDAGGFIAGTAQIDYRLASTLSLGFGATVWRFFGHGDAVVVSPSIGLLWQIGHDETVELAPPEVIEAPIVVEPVEDGAALEPAPPE